MFADDCRELGALISAYADGELEGAELERAEAHLAACDACRVRVEAYREMDAAAADRTGQGAEVVTVEASDDYSFAVDGFEDSVAVTFIADAGDVE